MKSDRPSRTAHYVAFGRAMADAGMSHVPGFHDSTARVFLNEKGKLSLKKTESRAREGKRGFSFAPPRAMADLIALRTVAIDAAVCSAIADGARQLVILGAGYDGRAWRLPELAGVKVFEIDYPSTQEDKRARSAELPPPTGDLTFVSIDFERESLDAVLEKAGHVSSLPTCWIWEGVVMYLTHEAINATLGAIAGRSASGSTLIVNYHTEHRGFIASLLFRFIGEPQISAWTPEEMATNVRAVGFLVRDDSGMADWNERFANNEANVKRSHYMRVAVARKL